MQMKKVYSSHVEALGYDPDTQELEIQFKKGKAYVYMGVPADVANLVVDAPSVGTAIKAYITGRYAHGIKNAG